MKYFRKPAEIEAFRFMGHKDDALLEWIRELEPSARFTTNHKGELAISVPNSDGGTALALKGNWIVEDGEGYFMVWGNTRFTSVYKGVEDDYKV